MSKPEITDQGDAPLDPAAMYALLQNQQSSIAREMGAFVPVMAAVWGVGWIISFVALWLVDGLKPAFSLPLPVAAIIFIASMVIAGVISIAAGVRSNRGLQVSAESKFTGTVYGVTWSVGSTALAVFGAGLFYNGMSGELANFFYPSAYVFFVGIMYLLAGAIWHEIACVWAGAAIVAVAVIAPFIPFPLHYLFFAVAGGGTFLVLAVVMGLNLRRLRSLTQGAARGR